MRKLIMLLILAFTFLFSKNSYTQDSSIEIKKHQFLDSFDLSDFALPELNYHSLSLRGNYNMNNANRLYSSDLNKKLAISTALDIFSYCYRNSPKQQLSGSGSLNMNYYYYKNKDKQTNKTYNSNESTIRLNFNRDLKFYYKPKRFYGADVYLNSNFLNQEYDNKLSAPNDTKVLFASINLGFNIGTGRVEDVTDAWNTIYLLKDFSRLNILDHNPSDEEILQVASTISKIRNKRFFDYRLKRIAEIKAIDEVLKTNQLVNQHDIEYFTSLNDMYYYSHNFRRFAGKRFTLGLRPTYSISKSYINNINQHNYYGLGLKLNYVNYKPINMFWQFDTQYSLYTYYYSNPPFYHDTKRQEHIVLRPSASASLAYIPSTRTVIKTKIEARLNIEIYDNSGFKTDKYPLYFKWSNSIDYYFSPRLSASAEVILLYGSTTYSEFTNNLYPPGNTIDYYTYNKGFGHNTRILFRYSIF